MPIQFDGPDDAIPIDDVSVQPLRFVGRPVHLSASEVAKLRGSERALTSSDVFLGPDILAESAHESVGMTWQRPKFQGPLEFWPEDDAPPHQIK